MCFWNVAKLEYLKHSRLSIIATKNLKPNPGKRALARNYRRNILWAFRGAKKKERVKRARSTWAFGHITAYRALDFAVCNCCLAFVVVVSVACQRRILFPSSKLNLLARLPTKNKSEEDFTIWKASTRQLMLSRSRSNKPNSSACLIHIHPCAHILHLSSFF